MGLDHIVHLDANGEAAQAYYDEALGLYHDLNHSDGEAVDLALWVCARKAEAILAQRKRTTKRLLNSTLVLTNAMGKRAILRILVRFLKHEDR